MGVRQWVQRLRLSNGNADEMAVRAKVAAAILEAKKVTDELANRIEVEEQRGRHHAH